MKISVEFSSRQTGATTKAIGTCVTVSEGERALLVSLKRKPLGIPNIISAGQGDQNCSRGKKFDRVVFNDWWNFTLENRVNWWHFVKGLEPKEVYVFGEPLKPFDEEAFETVVKLKAFLANKNLVCISPDIKELFFDFATEPGAILKQCTYISNREIESLTRFNFSNGPFIVDFDRVPF